VVGRPEERAARLFFFDRAGRRFTRTRGYATTNWIHCRGLNSDQTGEDEVMDSEWCKESGQQSG